MERSTQDRCRFLLSKQVIVLLLSMFVSHFYTLQVHAAVSDVTVSDVTTRAFSVVWVSDEAITSATVRVYSDIEGANQVIAGIALNLVSPPAALINGIAKVDVTGLAADTVYYIDTETVGDTTGSVFFPEAASTLIEVKTALSTTRENLTGGPIVNDLIQHEIFEPDGITESQGTLLMLKIPSISSYPLTAFVGEGFSVPQAVVDLNNLFEDASGISAEVLANTIMELSEFRGLLCNIEDQKKTLKRRVPAHVEVPSITELEGPAACFSPGGASVDFNCDSRIGLADLGALAARFGLEQPDCRFNLDFDFNEDGRVGLFDLGALAAAFGTSE